VVGRDEALLALQRELTEREFEFATVLEVADGGSAGFLLRVRSGRRLYPHTVVLAADEASLGLDHSVGEPLDADDVQTWVQGVVLWLMEQLDTGVLRWGQRVTLDNGTRAIDPSLDPGPPSPWYVTSVSLQRPTPAGQRRLRRLARGGRRRTFVVLGEQIGSEPDPAPGGHLRDVGFDVRPGRATHADGRLIRWLQLDADDSAQSAPVGQLVVSWRDDPGATAHLEHLECDPSAPADAVEELMLAGVHAAADAGARWVEHRLDGADRLLTDLPWEIVDGITRLDAAEIP
jgi:hypothetical protein